MGDAPQQPQYSSAQQALVDVWEQHLEAEFVTRNVERSLATMVEDAYVNHIPVLTGGVGREALRAFYSQLGIGAQAPAPRRPGGFCVGLLCSGGSLDTG